MLEELCRDAFYNVCREVVHNDRLVRLRGESKKNERKFADFFGRSAYDWNCIPLAKISRTKPGSIPRMSWVWFNENADGICKAYIKKRFGGNLEQAMKEAGTFNVFFDSFKEYFADRRKERMEQVENALQKRKQALAKQGKTPQSHGGVANLLKVLTKTMQQQGNSIFTVAKVQYAVCIQAGIYIPDEFLTDVITAADIMEG